jgi:hypothetical protein
VIWLFGTIGITVFFIWLTGIRNQKHAVQDTSSESTRSNKKAAQSLSKVDIAHEHPKLKPSKKSTKPRINNCRAKKWLLGLGLAFCVSVAVNTRLDFLYGRYVAIDLSLVQKTPRYIFFTALSPTFTLCLSYPVEFRQLNYSRFMKKGYAEREAIEKSTGFEGLLWGLAQSLAFYLPFILFPKTRSSDGCKDTEETSS